MLNITDEIKINDKEITYIPIKDLIPYENNARTHSVEQIDKLKNSLKEFGFINPVIIDENNMILVGHGRVISAKELNILEAPCIRINHLSEDKKRAYILADNKLSDMAGWDFNILNLELETINFDMEQFGFEIENIEDVYETDFELSTDDKPQTRTITLSLCEEQFEIIMKCIDYIEINDSISNDYGNANKKSNLLFEVVYQWAEQKKLL